MIKIMGLLFFALLGKQSIAYDGQKVLAGFDPKKDILSDKYEAGPFLIYDCHDGHWVCVAKSFYHECEEKRAADQDAKKMRAQCAPIGEFPTKKSCFQRQLYMTGHNHGSRFCVLPDWKEKEIILDFSKDDRH